MKEAKNSAESVAGPARGDCIVFIVLKVFATCRTHS